MDLSLRFIRNGDVDVRRRSITIMKHRDSERPILSMQGKPESGDYVAHLRLADGKELLVKASSEYVFRHLSRRTIKSNINQAVEKYGVSVVDFGLLYNDNGVYHINGKPIMVDADDESSSLVVHYSNKPTNKSSWLDNRF
jgi:hypothetical protein